MKNFNSLLFVIISMCSSHQVFAMKKDTPVIIPAKALCNQEVIAFIPYFVTTDYCSPGGHWEVHSPNNKTSRDLKKEWQNWGRKSYQEKKKFTTYEDNKNKNIDVIIAYEINNSKLGRNFFLEDKVLDLTKMDPIGFITDVTPEGFKFKIVVSTRYGKTSKSMKGLRPGQTVTTYITNQLHTFEYSFMNGLTMDKQPKLWRTLVASAASYADKSS